MYLAIQLVLSLASSRHRKALWDLCGDENIAVKRQGVEGIGGVVCNHDQSGHQAMSCVCWQNVAETWRYSQRHTNAPPSESTTEIPSCPLLRSSCLLRHCQGPSVRFIAHFGYESHSLSMLPYISNFLKINNFKIRKI